MADKTIIRSYRIIWTIVYGELNYPYASSYRTSPFTINNGDWYLKIKRTRGPDFDNTKFRFILCKPDKTKILSSSFYLMWESLSKCIKLDNFSPFETTETEFILTDGYLMLVCAFDIECVMSTTMSHENTENWLETKTIAVFPAIFDIPFINPISSDVNPQVYLLNISGLKEEILRLEISNKGGKLKHRMVGLDSNKLILIEHHDDLDELLSVELCVGPRETEHGNGSHGRYITISAVLFEFRKMIEDRIYKISELIRKSCSVSLTNKKMIVSKSFQAQRCSKPKKIEAMYYKSVTFKETSSPPSTNASSSCSSGIPSEPEAKTTTSNQSSLANSFPYMKFCDITIQVPGGRNIRAHKFILSGKSTVWRELLNNDKELSSITIVDLEKDIIEALVNFIYIGYVPEPPKSIEQLLIASDTYGIDDLKEWCEEHLINTITVQSAIDLLILANRYNASDLFEKVLNFVRQHIADIKERQEFHLMFFKNPELALKLFNNII